MIEIPHTYPCKKDNDEILMFIRKHNITYIFLTVFILFLLLIPLVIIISLVLNNAEMSSDAVEIVTLSIGIYLLVAAGLVLQFFVDYYLDMLVLTQDRLIYVRQNGYFNNQVDEVYYRDIEEVGSDMKGFLKSTFNYGEVVLHPGNEQAVLTMDYVPDPRKVASLILQKHKEQTDRKSEQK